MRPNPNRGRVYRRCGYRDSHGRQLGTRCPRLSNTRHGSGAYAVDMPSLNGKRKTRRRSGYATKTEASTALAKTLECERAGVHLDDTETVAQYLTGWLQERSRTLKPTPSSATATTPPRT
ncbi:Arm DNA-binding domain-containing protein [Couchioplanes caeruleus]|uniref:Arm DNA-binding domain-containing protein n=1 Tax=Couchioplanes caeruleus TaxID=56438 RepID=UPI0008FF5BF2|nr:Arm DNA-binding domain-containing protein [Couchioplanes caeruleus]